jgi:hypothetical protein
VLSYIAILAGVGMCRFEDQNVASIHVPAILRSKWRKRPLLSLLPPMALAVAQGEMWLSAAREVASCLGLEKRSQWTPAVVLGGMACAIASGYTRFRAILESARTRQSVDKIAPYLAGGLYWQTSAALRPTPTDLVIGDKDDRPSSVCARRDRLPTSG